MSGDIEADDYRIIKAENEERITRLEARLRASVIDTIGIEPLWINNKLQGKKNGANHKKIDLSHEVNLMVQNSNHLNSDLKLLSDILVA